jgi:RNA polymerase sigma-70 factor (ECF subfamily)
LEDLLHIVRGCANNDAKYQKIFYERFLSYALKIAFRYVHSYERASDAANDSFIKIFRNFNRFEIRDPLHAEAMLMSWMKRIIVNTSIDFLKQESLISDHKPIDEGVWQVKSSGHTGEDNLLYKELIVLVKKLSPAYRVVFNLHVIEGYSHQEIAEMLGISVGTSKSNLAKAKAALQKHFITDNQGNVLCFT